MKSKEIALYSRREKKMKKKFVIAGLVLGMAVAVSACGAKSETKESTTAAASQEEGTKAAESKAEASSEKAEADIKTGDKPESTTITFAQGASGNVLVSIAKAQGYFDAVGLTVNEIPLDDGQLQAVSTGQVDIASNSGTWTPIKMIAAGDDMAIIGGNMLTGCMPVIAKEETEYKGPESFLGKKMAGSVSQYALYHTLEEEGHDVKKEITFVDGMSDADKLQAVLKGEIDYATMGTNMMYQILNTKGIKIVTFCSDETPNYSCCRMVARESWVQKNPTTVKLLNEALIRAQAYFSTHREETVDLMVKQLGANKEYVEAYLLNEHYRINPDTLKNTVMDNYKYMEKVGGIENQDSSVNLEDRIYAQLYKEALDEAQQKWGSENPEFYEEAQKFFTEHNT